MHGSLALGNAMKIGQLCKREIVSVLPATPLSEAARLMRQHHVGSVLVVDAAEPRKLVGIVTDRDIVVEVVASSIDPRTVAVGEIMTAAVMVAHEEDDVLTALKTMRWRGVRRLPVVDGSQNLCGILTLDDLLELGSNIAGDLAQAITSEQALESWHRA